MPSPDLARLAAKPRCAGPDPNQLDAAAAEIGDHAIRVGYPGEHPGGGEPRLFSAPSIILTGTPHWRSTSAAKALSVAGVAHRGCRQHRQMIDGDGAGERDEAAQIDQRKATPSGFNRPVDGDPAPETRT